jgi:uridine monophosphate synthetase
MLVTSQSFSERAQLARNPVAKALLLLMDEKQTNLAVNIDSSSANEVLEMANLLGPEICVLKTHVDILDDFSREWTEKLQEIAQKHKFLIFEDRKFADIGHIASKQYAGGVYKIADWADITNAHAIPGPGIIEGLQTVGLPKKRGLLLLAEMSSKGSLANKDYAQAVVEMAQQYPDFVMGFISQRRLSANTGHIHMTPGVSLTESGDSLGQQYKTAEYAIKTQKTDVIIVGRGIVNASDPKEKAAEYRHEAWVAYKAR